MMEIATVNVIDNNTQQCFDLINDSETECSIEKDDHDCYYWTYGSCVNSYDELGECYVTLKACVTSLCLWLAKKLHESDTLIHDAVRRVEGE